MMPQLIYGRDLDRAGWDRRTLARRALRGELVRLRNGVYVDAGSWAGLPWWRQYRLHIDAALGKGACRRVLVQNSAAVVWGMPTIGRSFEVQLLAAIGTHGRRRAGIRWHGDELLEPLAEYDGCTVTGRAQTVIDMAAHLPFERAVPAMDHVLRVDAVRRLPALDRDELFDLAGRLPTEAKVRRAQKVVRFADPHAQSAGESFSRALMYLHRFPPPELQHEVHDSNGIRQGITDFYWPEHKTAGEFDGHVKYSRGEYLKGTAPADAVVREKIREDNIRATGLKFARWTWQAAWNPESLQPRGLFVVLRQAGLRQDRRSNAWPGM
jgi:hypothetical protein